MVGGPIAHPDPFAILQVVRRIGNEILAADWIVEFIVTFLEARAESGDLPIVHREYLGKM